MSDRPLTEFERGYLCAVSNLVQLHGAEVEATDVMREAGITWKQVVAADLCEMDMANFAKIKGGRNCPFRTGGEHE